ncbi:MAG: DNA-binding transcriptional regulator, LysR family [Gammaproteobacteria bacterium]|jgi:DNA-binding transcriptional LysR family regulator|nr:DNA-binding transcriptional regulator, LysR family [Gammaproteobacteria bacterium]
MNRAQFAELNAFVAVAERTNFARAAAHLGIAASTISQTIRSLEERLGMRLLNRTTRSVSLTDAGEKLLARIRPAIMELGAAVEDLNEFRDTPTGTLRLNVSSVPAQIVLAPVIKAFLAAYPAIALDITVDDGHGDIVSGRFDAGIRVGRRVAKDMQIVRVSEPSRLIAIAAPEYLQQHPAPKAPQDLQRHNCIGLRINDQLFAWEFAKGKSKIEMAVNGSLIVNTMDLAVRAALDGIGVGYTIESYVASHLAAGRLVPLLADWSPGHHSYYLYYSGRRQLPVPLKVFSAFLRQLRAASRA